ncbi:MAG: hypothetical protein B9S33_14550 [Pedosphaera sp. Tous-C6FEB]|nr:MAG: hypothetical protein B9S33_14550 [Pedosphaera sp. Tous-C6FEB]
MTSTFSHRFTRPALTALGMVVFLAVCFWPRQPKDSLNVPLGVEQAAIVTYSGPPVAVMPYKWGVAVNVRIARITEQPGVRIYDVRYLVNRPGNFDLKDYLTAENGARLDGLPSFKFHGDPKLSKHLDARIQETEEMAVSVGGYYYFTLGMLGVLWIGWLLLLIFYGRAKPAPPAVALPEPTLAERLRPLLAQLEAGTLDAAAKAQLEMLLLRRWREELAVTNAPMDTALDAINRSEQTGQPLRQLQHWLHHPASPVRREEIAAVIAPYTVEAEKAEAQP